MNLLKTSSLKSTLFTIVTAILLIPSLALSQENNKEASGNNADSSRKVETPSVLKPYKDVITSKAVSQKGMFTVHKIGEKYYFEVPRNMLGREVLLVVRTVQTGAGLGYGGESLSETLFRWDLSDNGKKIFLKSPYLYNVADKDSHIYQAFKNSFVEPIFYAFDIKTFGEDSSAVIDVTELYSKDVITFGISEMKKSKFGVGNIEDNKSFLHYIKAFPENIECRSQKTYKRSGKVMGGAESNGFVTFVIHHSMMLLPEKPMMPRLEDERVGMFTQGQTDYSYDYFKIKKTKYIRKWRLEPKDPEAYFRGELTEPVKPIVFYIDPATPAKLIPYFKLAVEDWQVAFEAAGFKNAIVAKEVPSKEEDPDWDAMDARYSMINYLASEEQNAYGPHVADPRSGEIIEAHVCIYHNVMKLLSDWFIIQTAGSNPEARKLTLSDELMGALYRQAVCHEVGHSLGLPHNFAASGAIPVDSLRSPSYTDKYGTTMSIMDYARYNYIAQPGDGVKRYIPIVGPYDKYNINWAYRVIPGAKTPAEEVPALDKIVEEKLGDRTYLYVKHSLTQKDPRGQTEDLGDDPIKASEYAMKNLKYVTENFDKWISEPSESYDNIKAFYEEIFRQWRRYIGHVTTNIGGLHETYKKQFQDGPAYWPVDKEKQIESLNFLFDNVFEFPHWLVRRDLIDKFDDSGLYERNIRAMQAGALADILSNAPLSRMADYTYKYPDAYRIEDMLSSVRDYLFKDVLKGKDIDIYRKSLQRTYLDRLKYLGPKNPDREKRDMGVNVLLLNDVQTIAWNEMLALRQDLGRAIKKYSKGSLMRAHLDLMTRDLEMILKIE